mmetsp:Transcript_5823/g.15877  ORF Transcript_5823/g.15877 Transcript_5823/m.15877 type:complete len:222 (+) Transcript_5823:162-827(+)
MPSVFRMDSVCARKKGFVSSSRRMVVGTVGLPAARMSSISWARATRAGLLGSTPRLKRALVCVYSCAQKTRVSGGRRARRSSDSLAMAGVPSKRRPQPRAKSASPTNAIFSFGRWKAMCPVVCPGTSITSTRVSPSCSESPPLTPSSMPGIRARSASAATTLHPNFALSSRLPPAWSSWWCVLRICVRVHPAFSHARDTDAASGVSMAAVAPDATSWMRKP